VGHGVRDLRGLHTGFTMGSVETLARHCEKKIQLMINRSLSRYAIWCIQCYAKSALKCYLDPNLTHLVDTIFPFRSYLVTHRQ
jgi:hypothetical protein